MIISKEIDIIASMSSTELNEQSSRPSYKGFERQKTRSTAFESSVDDLNDLLSISEEQEMEKFQGFFDMDSFDIQINDKQDFQLKGILKPSSYCPQTRRITRQPKKEEDRFNVHYKSCLKVVYYVENWSVYNKEETRRRKKAVDCCKVW